MNHLPHQHSFDFKVNVDYRNGNVTLQGPNACPPPSNINFVNQYKNHQINSNLSQTTNSTSSYDPFNRKIWKSSTKISTESHGDSHSHSYPIIT